MDGGVVTGNHSIRDEREPGKDLDYGAQPISLITLINSGPL